jgi:hypothetical protein
MRVITLFISKQATLLQSQKTGYFKSVAYTYKYATFLKTCRFTPLPLSIKPYKIKIQAL